MMSSGFAGAYFKILEMDEEKQEEYATSKWVIGTIIMVVSLIAINLWWFFFIIEFKQFRK